jgi:hypothetical protein
VSRIEQYDSENEGSTGPDADDGLPLGPQPLWRRVLNFLTSIFFRQLAAIVIRRIIKDVAYNIVQKRAQKFAKGAHGAVTSSLGTLSGASLTLIALLLSHSLPRIVRDLFRATFHSAVQAAIPSIELDDD